MRPRADSRVSRMTLSCCRSRSRSGGLFVFRLQPRGLGLLPLHVGLLRRQLSPLGFLLGGLLLRERRLARRVGFSPSGDPPPRVPRTPAPPRPLPRAWPSPRPDARPRPAPALLRQTRLLGGLPRALLFEPRLLLRRLFAGRGGRPLIGELLLLHLAEGDDARVLGHLRRFARVRLRALVVLTLVQEIVGVLEAVDGFGEGVGRVLFGAREARDLDRVLGLGELQRALGVQADGRVLFAVVYILTALQQLELRHRPAGWCRWCRCGRSSPPPPRRSAG